MFSNRASSDGPIKRQRLERIISNRGVGSRKEIQKFLKQGRICVGERNNVIKGGADRYDVNCKIFVDGEIVEAVPLLACYNKPVGVVSTMNDGHWGRDSLQDLHDEYPFLKMMHPVGRLDRDTSGLLLFSSNGQLTNTLLHPNTEIEREYEAMVVGKVDSAVLGRILDDGVKTEDGVFRASLLDSKVLQDKVTIPRSLIHRRGSQENDKVDHYKEESVLEVDCSYVKLSVTEGKYRMVRRILHNSAGHSVINLHRVRYGNIILKETLEEGSVQPITKDETAWAKSILFGGT